MNTFFVLLDTGQAQAAPASWLLLRETAMPSTLAGSPQAVPWGAVACNLCRGLAWRAVRWWSGKCIGINHTLDRGRVEKRWEETEQERGTEWLHWQSTKVGGHECLRVDQWPAFPCCFAFLVAFQCQCLGGVTLPGFLLFPQSSDVWLLRGPWGLALWLRFLCFLFPQVF